MSFKAAIPIDQSSRDKTTMARVQSPSLYIAFGIIEIINLHQ